MRLGILAAAAGAALAGLELSAGNDLIGESRSRSDERLRSPERAEQEFQAAQGDQTMSRQVRRWRERRGLPT